MRRSFGLISLIALACRGDGGSVAIDGTPPLRGSYDVRAVVPVRLDSRPGYCVLLLEPPPRPGCRNDTTSVYVITGTVDVGKLVAGREAGSWSAPSAIALSVTRYGADLQPGDAARRCSAQPITCWLAMAPFDARAMASWPAAVTILGPPWEYGWALPITTTGWDAGHDFTATIEYSLHGVAGGRYYDSTAGRTLEVVKR